VRETMKRYHQCQGFLVIALLTVFTLSCGKTGPGQHPDAHDEPSEGPHGGRMLMQGNFSLELSIFETGTPPEFRAWASFGGQALEPSEVDLKIRLTRLGGKVDEINFKPYGDALRGDTVVYEPHSFLVDIDASHQGVKYHWQYESFEGRTTIARDMARALGIKTAVAGPAVLQETIRVFGKVLPQTERVRHVSARFTGVIRSAPVSVGDVVRRGQILATVESNESLQLYDIKAPIGGIITRRNANPGEQAGAQVLFDITDISTVWVDLSIFPADRARVTVGAPVHFTTPGAPGTFKGEIAMLNILAEANQAITARMIIENSSGRLLPGDFVTARIKVGEVAVPLAVQRTGLQAYRDFTVVYARIGETYEVRMLELGREDDEWAEVLEGLDAGVHYVTTNSYVVKADIEKSGVSHDH